MTERQIRDYLLGLIDVSELENVDEVTTDKVRPYWKVVDMIDEGKFVIEPRHLVNICDEVLNKKLRLETIDNFALILIGSDYFTWDTETVDGERIGQVLFEWNNSTINYPLTMDNVRQW
ncbi:MAG: hypothetical protein IM631_02665 [Cytophagales bacterium]|jgi:hypothetical protein|nr:hypothetical protein [Cytophagales bacterium]